MTELGYSSFNDLENILDSLEPSQPAQQDPTQFDRFNELDELMRDVEINHGGAQPSIPATSNYSTSGPVATGIAGLVPRGPSVVSTGPGLAPRGGNPVVSTGPGANFAKPDPKPPPGPGTGGFASHTPDGRAIRVNAVQCNYCGEDIVGRVTNAMGKQFHPEHFVCSTCSQPFPGGKFVEHEGQAYCETHYHELFAPKCHSCERPITTSVIKALDVCWHPEHFTCQGCGVSLVGKVYKEAGGEPYCSECKKNLVITVDPKLHLCGKCKKPIIGEYILLNGQYLHPEHFSCASCGVKFLNGDCHEYQQKIYCKECYDKLLVNTCAGCRKPITGRSITAMGRIWHPEHFSCAHCHEPFNGAKFYERSGLPYCEVHFKQLFGRLCSKCNEGVIKDGVETLGKIWHASCFVCQGCDSQLSLKTKLFSWEGKPMCKKCYLKLPANVRKQIEKVAQGEAKAEKARKKKELQEAKQRDKEAKKLAKQAKKNNAT